VAPSGHRDYVEASYLESSSSWDLNYFIFPSARVGQNPEGMAKIGVAILSCAGDGEGLAQRNQLAVLLSTGNADSAAVVVLREG